MAKTPKNSAGSTKTVESLKHDEATRKNIPTAEYQSVLQKNEQRPIRVAYERRNRDLDPSSSGAVRTSRTGAISSSTRRHSTSKKRCIPRS